MIRRGSIATATLILLTIPLLAALSGCKVKRHRSNAMRQIMLEQRLLELQRQKVEGREKTYRLEQEIEARHKELEHKDRELHQVRERHAVRMRELNEQLTQLQRMEEDLVAAKKRRAAAEAELLNVRKLERQVAEKDRLAAQLQARLDAVSKQLAARRQEVTKGEGSLKSALQMLQARETRLTNLTKQVRAALAESKGDGAAAKTKK